MNIAFNIDWLTYAFDPISLDELNAKAEMMRRTDNKYVVTAGKLQQALPALQEAFEVLEIKDQRAFTYETRYYDDAAQNSFYEHHSGRRQRFKLRARQYVDAGLCFLEVKVKGQRGMTEKFRIPYAPEQIENLTPEAYDFTKGIYTGKYEKPFDYDLKPSLQMRYRRITLVAREGGERMTIDTDLKFLNGDKSRATGNGVFIVETKSENGRGIADKILRAVGERPTPRCSKYCVGMAATGQVGRFNRFLPALRKLGLDRDARPAARPAQPQPQTEQMPSYIISNTRKQEMAGVA